jgi:hypothetical protein
MKQYKSLISIKVEKASYLDSMLITRPRYCKEIKYEDLEPRDVPVKAYWLNWSTTT